MEMTAVFKKELKEALKEESYFNEWDNQSLKEVEELIRTYWNSSNTDIEEYVAWDMQFFLNDTDFLCWYFEDETAQEVIRHIMDYEDNEAVLSSCMNDGTRKLNNGVIVRCTI